MMRYQRVSPDCVPLSTSNGKKPNGGAIHQSSPSPSPPPPPLTTTTITTTNANNVNLTPSSSSFEPSKAFRFRSPSRTPDHNSTSTNNNHFDTNNNGFHSHNNHSRNHNHHHHHETAAPQQRAEGSPSDKLLQWRQKRSRVSRTEIRALTDDSSSSSSAQARQQSLKTQRRLVGPTTPAAAAMPPPPPPPPLLLSTIPSSSSNGRARKESSGSLLNRNLEDRSGAVNGSPSRNSGGNIRVASRSTVAGKRSPPPEKSEKKISSSARIVNEKPNGSSAQADRVNHIDSALLHHEQETRNNNNASCAPKEEKASTEVIEWPRIQIALSRKEKEDDFLIMKGTKLPQRPKKRPKNVERALQFCFPGMWLSDVSKSRYEVKEKKCVKKQQKRRGLKGMESLDSDSE